MKQWFTGIIAVFVIAFCSRCNNTNNGIPKMPEYGHSSVVFRPFVDIMENMDKYIAAIKSENDADRDFANLLRIYHIAAIRMANVEVKQGTDSTIKRIAHKIIKERILETSTFEILLKSDTRGLSTDSFIIEAVRPIPINNLEMQSKQVS